MLGEENRHCSAFMLWECAKDDVAMVVCWIRYDGL